MPVYPRTLAFARDYFLTMRPYLLFVSGITGLAGLAFAPGVSLPSFVLLFAACFLSYGFGQALTDCSQLDTDALSAPYRPLVRGTIRVRDVAVVSLCGLAAVGVTLIWHNRWNVFPVTLAIVGLATYTPLKRRWWGGPFYNAAIVGLLFLIGYLSGIGEGVWPGPGRMPAIRPGLSAAFWPTAGVVFFGYANFVLSGYFKDVAADRASGYRTLPVAFGRRLAARVSDAFAAAAVVAAVLAVAMTRAPDPAVVPFVGLALVSGVAAAAVGQRRLHRVRRDADAHRAIEPVVHSYLLFLAAITALHQPLWAPFLAAFYGVFALAIRVRPERVQI